MAIIESWYFNDIKLFSLPITHRMTIERGRNARGEKGKILIRDEDTIIVQRRYPKGRTSFVIDAPPFVTEVDELLRLRHLPEYIHQVSLHDKRPSEQALYQDEINIEGGVSARRLGRLHSRITWQTSLYDEPTDVEDRNRVWYYQSNISPWINQARTIFQMQR